MKEAGNFRIDGYTKVKGRLGTRMLTRLADAPIPIY